MFGMSKIQRCNMVLSKALSFDAQFGMMVFGDGYSFGFAIPHLLQSSTGLQASSTLSSVAENDQFSAFSIHGALQLSGQ